MITVLAIILAAYLLAGVVVAGWVLVHSSRERSPDEPHPAALFAVTVLAWPWAVRFITQTMRDYDAEQEREPQP